MPKLFTELKINNVTFRNRIGMSPMCAYASVEGATTDWLLEHPGARVSGFAARPILSDTDGFFGGAPA